jgi:nucleoside-diphosphate-sugar epimerase
MRIFVTGATGFVGSAILADLLAQGHQVVGLTRDERKAQALRARGVEAHVGDLHDPAGLAHGARTCDAVIHTAFDHDFSRFEVNCEVDARAIEALGNALAGTTRPLVVTSGMANIAPGRMATERDGAPTPSPTHPRRSEAAVDALAARGIRACVVRLPPSVHGRGDHAFLPFLIQHARKTGCSAWIADGGNRWSAVHCSDAARLYRLALKVAKPGDRFHAVAEEGIAFREIAERISQRLGVSATSLPAAEAARHFGWFARFAAMDALASSDTTRRVLGWTPAGAPLLADLDESHYFAT